MHYRFRPEASLAETARDVATAASWLKVHAEQYGGDGSRIALMAIPPQLTSQRRWALTWK